MHVMIEKTKLYDTIYAEHKIKIHQLHVAVEKFRTNEEPEVIALKIKLDKMEEDAAVAAMEKVELSTCFEDKLEEFSKGIPTCDDVDVVLEEIEHEDEKVKVY